MWIRRLQPGAAILAIAIAAGGCGNGEPATTEPSSTTAAATTVLAPTAPPAVPSDYAGFRAQPTACGGDQPPPAGSSQYGEPDDLGLEPTVKLRATITTSCGPIVVELDPGQAPATVNSFVFLARSGYFDGTASHRVIPGFVIQAGDPTATGIGGPGYVVPDELPEEGFAYELGVMAMANAGPNSTGSQFFIMVGDSGLPPLYSAFGIVVDGFDTLQNIVNVPLGPNSRGEVSVPLETVYIESIEVTEAN